MGKAVGKEACPQCQAQGRDNSGDNLTRYEDGSGHCFSCKYNEGKSGKQFIQREEKVSKVDISQVKNISSVRALKERGISKDVCEKYGVRVSVDEATGDNSVHFYPYTDKGKVVAYKQRRLPKEFSTIGNMKKASFFGQNLFEGVKRKMLVIEEGEVDCLSAVEIFKQAGKNYAVVSLPFGATEGGVHESVRNQVQFLELFEVIVIRMDDDSVGQAYAQTLADWLCTSVKVRIMSLAGTGFKDTNEILMAGKGEVYLKKLSDSKEYQPEAIVTPEVLDYDLVRHVPHKGFEFPWEGLNSVLKGLRKGELTLVTAGSGLGKTSFIRQIADHVPAKFGYMSLEESVEMAVRQFIALRCGVPSGRLTFNPDCIPEEIYKEAFEHVAKSGKYTFFDSSKFLDFDSLMNKVSYFAKAVNCDFLVIDNLTLVAARSGEGDERKAIDRVMADLAGIAANTGMGIVLVNHLKRAQGKSPNNGDMVEIQDLRGSGSLEAFSNNIIALERNQQSDDEAERNTLKVRVLKNRLIGRTGIACKLQYNTEDGRLYEQKEEF